MEMIFFEQKVVVWPRWEQMRMVDDLFCWYVCVIACQCGMCWLALAVLLLVGNGWIGMSIIDALRHFRY